MGNGNESNDYGNEGGINGNGNNTCKSNSKEGWRAMKSVMARVARAMTTATKRAMATAAKVMAMATRRAIATVGEGNVDDSKSDG
jgi:hypothetical protein